MMNAERVRHAPVTDGWLEAGPGVFALLRQRLDAGGGRAMRSAWMGNHYRPHKTIYNPLRWLGQARLVQSHRGVKSNADVLGITHLGLASLARDFDSIANSSVNQRSSGDDPITD